MVAGNVPDVPLVTVLAGILGFLHMLNVQRVTCIVYMIDAENVLESTVLDYDDKWSVWC